MTSNPAFEMNVVSGEKKLDTALEMNEVTTVFQKTTEPPPAVDMYTGSADDDTPQLAQPTQPAYANGDQSNSGTAVWHSSQNTTVVVNQPAARPGSAQPLDSDRPIPTTCFNCGTRIVTYLYYDSGSCTWVSCVALALIGCDLGCCLIPFCFDYFKDAYHKCPKCHVVLGKHKRLGC